jgi:hypothetical protein
MSQGCRSSKCYAERSPRAFHGFEAPPEREEPVCSSESARSSFGGARVGPRWRSERFFDLGRCTDGEGRLGVTRREELVDHSDPNRRPHVLPERPTQESSRLVLVAPNQAAPEPMQGVRLLRHQPWCPGAAATSDANPYWSAALWVARALKDKDGGEHSIRARGIGRGGRRG